MADYSLHGLVSSTELPNKEGVVEIHTTSLSILLLRQWGVLLLLLLSCRLEGSASDLKWHGDVCDGHRLAGFVNCD